MSSTKEAEKREEHSSTSSIDTESEEEFSGPKKPKPVAAPTASQPHSSTTAAPPVSRTALATPRSRPSLK